MNRPSIKIPIKPNFRLRLICTLISRGIGIVKITISSEKVKSQQRNKDKYDQNFCLQYVAELRIR